MDDEPFALPPVDVEPMYEEIMEHFRSMIDPDEFERQRFLIEHIVQDLIVARIIWDDLKRELQYPGRDRSNLIKDFNAVKNRVLKTLEKITFVDSSAVGNFSLDFMDAKEEGDEHN